MSEKDYYPLGAYEDTQAPWNQSELDEKEFDICISQTLSKNTTVNTNDYVIESGYLDEDEGGGYVDEIITNETDWNKAYNEEHYTPLELIKRFKKLLEEPDVKSILGREADYLIKECSDWVEEDVDIIEE